MKTRKNTLAGESSKLSRRHFLHAGAAAATFAFVPRHVFGAYAPSEKVNVAIIGTGGQGTVNMKQLFNEPDVRIAALCDINEVSDYSMFYYGGTAGLKPATELVRKRYGQACPTYHDYNEMLGRHRQGQASVLRETPLPHGLRNARRHRSGPQGGRRHPAWKLRALQRGYPPCL
ncbi:MAG: hypothetical protein P8Z79_11710 [Sedimentisphaerales bacterium]